MDELARLYARSLFEVAMDQNQLDEIHEQLDEFAASCRRTGSYSCSSSRPTSRLMRRRTASLR